MRLAVFGRWHWDRIGSEIPLAKLDMVIGSDRWHWDRVGSEIPFAGTICLFVGVLTVCRVGFGFDRWGWDRFGLGMTSCIVVMVGLVPVPLGGSGVSGDWFGAGSGIWGRGSFGLRTGSVT